MFYLIRHIKTGKYMPQMKRNRGYTHWNPGNPSAHKVFAALDTPRLLTSSDQARRCIDSWALLPNSENDLDGDIQVGINDGRKKSDLEIVECNLKVKFLGEPFWQNFK